MLKRSARRGLVVGLVALVAALVGPVAPASAATLSDPTFSPLDKASSFAPANDITLTFGAGKTMSAVTGGSVATLTNLLTNSAVPYATTFSSNVVTLNPNADLSGCTPYRLSFTNLPGAAYKDNQSTPDTWPGASTSITFLTAATSGLCTNAVSNMAGASVGGEKAVASTTTFGVCFANTISVFNGGADANITATTNTRAGGLPFTGTLGSFGGGTNNCLQFSLVVAATDISQQPLRVTAINLSNGAWIVETQPSGSPNTRTTSITNLNLPVNGPTGDPDVSVNAKPNVVAFTPMNNVNTVTRDSVVALTFNEAIRLVATKVINLRKDVNNNGSYDAGDTVLESFTIPTYVNALTGVNTTNNEYHSTSNETRIEVVNGVLGCATCSMLILRPNLDMDAAATYYLEIPSDAIVDTTSGTALAYAGLNTSGTLTYKFTTVADGASAWTTGPSVYQIDSTKADGSYKNGEGAFNVRLKFSSPVSLDGSSTAALKLNVVSGGFTTPNCTLADSVTLNCPYTIAAGHNSLNTLTFFATNRDRLNVASATALTVTGGTGFKGTGTGTPTASLTLPVYGSYGLGDGKAIKIDTTAPVPMGSNPPVADASMQGLVTVARDSNFLMFFGNNETLSTGSNKNLVITEFGGSVLETINTGSLAGRVTISGQQATINPTANLIGPNVAVSGATRTGNSVVYSTGSTNHGFKAPVSITAATVSSNVATITAASHGLIAGDRVFVAGLSAPTANGLKTVTSAADANTFTYATTGISDGALTLSSATSSHSVIVTNAGANYSTSGPNHCIVSAVDVSSSTKTFTCNVVTAGSTNGSATFSPAAAAGLQPETTYYITYDAGFFKDAAGNDIAALSTVPISVSPPTAGSWVFRSGVDTFPPGAVQSSTTLSCGGACVPVNSAITVTFNETVIEAIGCSSCDVTISPALASGTLGVSVSGTSVIVTPSAGLAAGTTYTLTIDRDRITDGSGNKPAADVTVTFTTATPGGGGAGGGGAGGGAGGGGAGDGGAGAGAGGSCGPPPLPPCNVGPGINFGPGGMIQNPGAIVGGDMGNLRPDNFTGFRPDDARNLGAGAMQNFRPDQFGALPPSAMGGFNRNQINNLNPAAMAGMSRDQFGALPPEAMQGFRPDQMAQLPPSAMAGFNANQMGQLPPSAMAGFNADQFRQMPPSAMAGFNANQMGQLPPSAMQGFNANQMSQLPPSAMQGFKSDQFAQLPPSAMAGFDPTKMKQLPPAAVAGFNPEQMAALPSEAMRVFDPSKMQQLPPAAMAGFDPSKMQALPPSAMAVMNPNQLNQMPPAAFGAIQQQQFNVLSPTAMQGFKAELMAALPPAMMQNFKLEQFAALPPTAMGGLNEDRFHALPPQAMTAFNPQQMGSVPPQAMEGMRYTQMNVIPPTAMQGFKPDQFAALPPQAMQGFKPDQFAALPPQALAGMEPEQIRVLPPQAARSMNPQQVTQVPPQAMAAIPPGVFKAFSPEAIAALTPEQRNALPSQALNPPPLAQPATAGNIGAIINSISGWNIDKVPPAAFTGMKPTDVAKLPADAFNALSPSQIGALPPAAMSGIKPTQMSSLPPEAMAAFKPTQLGQLPPAAMAAMSPAQISALPPAAMSAMKPAQAGQLPPEAFEAMSPTQFGALPPAAFGGLKPTQMSSLPLEAMAAFKPTQLGQLPPSAMAAMSPAQFSALPPAAMSAMKPAQAGQLPPEAFEAMSPTQFGQLPPAAFGGLKPTQVESLPLEAMAAMKPTQLGALPPNAIGALAPEQVAALPPAAMSQMKPTQAAALPVDAIAEMKPTQVGALPPAAVGGFKPEQVSALPPEAMAAMKPNQVAALKPAAMGGLEPEQIDALPPTALRQIDSKQLGAISADAMKSLDTAQINALPTEAFKGMKPDQANALSPDQARAMQPADVAQMSPSVRTIVNNLKAQPPKS